jgi:hypothetical protein
MGGIKLANKHRVVQMTEREKVLYIESQSGIPEKSLATKPEDFDPTSGHDISKFLRQNAKLESRGKELVAICNEILEKEPATKIVVFADGRIGAGEAARYALAKSGLGCTWLAHDDTVQEKNEKISWYQHGDATEADKQRPRVLLLHFEHAAGLNLQSECYNLIIFTPLYVGNGGTTDDPVADASTELQCIGRVYRAGQRRPQVQVFRIQVNGPEGEECLDGHLIRRNTDEETIAMAINADE